METRTWRLYSLLAKLAKFVNISQKHQRHSFHFFPGLSTVSAMPLFSWMNWSHDIKVQAQNKATPQKTSGGESNRTLIREILWHVKQRERLMRELEWENRLAQSALGLHWFQKHPRLQTLISTSELHQLEFLCGQIPPIHAATVLSRFREALATNNIRPWELASAFKQVLRDFLSREDNLWVQPSQLRTTESWTTHLNMKEGVVTPTMPNCGDHPREEIPTISGYVDQAMRQSSSFTGSNRDCDLPYYYPVPLRPIGVYSTKL